MRQDGEQQERSIAVERPQSRFGADGIMRCEEVELELDSWSDFVREFARDDALGWVFRGQADYTWGLGTSLQRAFADANVLDAEHRAGVENSTIGFFKDRSRLYLPSIPAESDLLAWLALMQHYGAPTRLQDWTMSPFVAAYFAYREDPKTDAEVQDADAAALWAIQAYYCRRATTPGAIGLPWDHLGVIEEVYLDPETGDEQPFIRSVLETQAERENDVLRNAIRDGAGWPMPMAPFNADARMAAQQAAFLVATKIDFPIDRLTEKKNWPLQAEPDPRLADAIAKRAPVTLLTEPHQLIKRIRLPWAWRDQALRTLKRMGITEDTMFPGVDGAGRATAHQIAAGDLPLRDILNQTV
jgi:hypothetical protein